MEIREITANDTEKFFDMLCRLDEETEFMMYEPGERQEKTKDFTRLNSVIASAVSGDDLLLIAETEKKEIVGFLHAERGKLNRIRHMAYVVVGIREIFRGQGIGTEGVRRLDDWAKEKGVVRLDLTVECPNTKAKNLYEKNGFQVEGIRSESMKVAGRLTDEYYMSKICD